MNIPKLKAKLLEDEFDPSAYRVLESPGESTWCLEKQGKTWQVFYFERGEKRDLHRFKDEAIACEYFYNRVAHG